MACAQVYIIEDDATACQPGQAPVLTFQPHVAQAGEKADTAGLARERGTNLGSLGTAAEVAQGGSTAMPCGDRQTTAEYKKDGDTPPEDGNGGNERAEGHVAAGTTRVLKFMPPHDEHAVVLQLAAACRAWLKRTKPAEDDAVRLDELDARLGTNSADHVMQQSRDSDGPVDGCRASRGDTLRGLDRCDDRSADVKGSSAEEGLRDVRPGELGTFNVGDEASSKGLGRTMCTADMNLRLALQYRRERKLLLQRVVEGLEVQAALVQPYL